VRFVDWPANRATDWVGRPARRQPWQRFSGNGSVATVHWQRFRGNGSVDGRRPADRHVPHQLLGTGRPGGAGGNRCGADPRSGHAGVGGSVGGDGAGRACTGLQPPASEVINDVRHRPQGRRGAGAAELDRCEGVSGKTAGAPPGAPWLAHWGGASLRAAASNTASNIAPPGRARVKGRVPARSRAPAPADPFRSRWHPCLWATRRGATAAPEAIPVRTRTIITA
jgi:hypothetical protein